MGHFCANMILGTNCSALGNSCKNLIPRALLGLGYSCTNVIRCHCCTTVCPRMKTNGYHCCATVTSDHTGCLSCQKNATDKHESGGLLEREKRLKPQKRKKSRYINKYNRCITVSKSEKHLLKPMFWERCDQPLADSSGQCGAHA
jgi:hypothetical protein